jgi:hypothetical protein
MPRVRSKNDHAAPPFPSVDGSPMQSSLLVNTMEIKKTSRRTPKRSTIGSRQEKDKMGTVERVRIVARDVFRSPTNRKWEQDAVNTKCRALLPLRLVLLRCYLHYVWFLPVAPFYHALFGICSSSKENLFHSAARNIR